MTHFLPAVPPLLLLLLQLYSNETVSGYPLSPQSLQEQKATAILSYFLLQDINQG